MQFVAVKAEIWWNNKRSSFFSETRCTLHRLCYCVMQTNSSVTHTAKGVVFVCVGASDGTQQWQKEHESCQRCWYYAHHQICYDL